MVQSLDDTRRRQQASRPASPGRVPPHNLQAEESLLGAMLLSRDAIADALEICSPDDFYKPAHAHVFEAIQSLYGQGEPVDPVTVAEELRRAQLLDAIGGPALLLNLQASTPATSNAARYARIVEEHALLRRLIGVAGEIAELGYSLPDDVEAAVDRAESMMFDVAQRRTSDTLAPLRALLEQSLDRLDQLYERNEAITGTPTGYADLDELTSGLQPSALYIVGARPGAGKTSFALGMASHAAMDARKPVLFFSLEMSHLELTSRLLCAEAKVDSARLRNGKLLEADWNKIHHAIGRLAEAPIYIDDNPNLTVMEIRSKARRLKAREGALGMIVVDYLQLMTGRSNAESRQVEVSEMSRGLKILARELETPVVALSQLSRTLETRADKRPMLADLRESGCMPASARLLRADNGQEVTLGELVLSQEQPLVWSLDDQWRIVPRRLVRAFPSGIKPVFRMRLASGREVEASANHPFRAVEGWRRLDELSKGDSIAVPRRCSPPVRAVERWDDDEVVLLAHLLGAGSVGPSVTYATRDERNRSVVEDAAHRLFGIEATAVRKGSTWQVALPSPYRVSRARHHPLRNWLEPLGLWGARANDRSVPEAVFSLPDEQIALFVRHLWTSGGSIRITGSAGREVVRVGYAATSRRLADGIVRLLARLDVQARVSAGRKSRHHESWNVRVEGADATLRFLSTVKCHGERGESVARALEIVSRREPNASGDAVTSDVLWDEIVEIVPIGEMPTFDATVEGTHNFIANGVIAHNSLEQDADVVMFIYRDELYNADTPDKGIAEVIVAKHRNGPTGVTNLAFLDRYTRFANMARV